MTVASSPDELRPDERQPIVLVSESVGAFAFLQPMLARRGPVTSVALGTDGLAADRIGAAIEELSPHGPVTLVGHSLGAVASATYAAADARVTALVLVAGWAAPSERQRIHARILAALESTATLDSTAIVDDYLAFTHYSEEHLAARRTRPARSTPAMAALTMAALASTTAVAPLLQHITASTLVIGCTADQLVAERQSLALFAGIADARYASLDSGHGVLDERPAERLSLVDAFLDEPARYPAGTTIPRMRP